MPRPRRLGSSPNLNRSLSRLSSSSSFSSRQSNSKIYVFLIAGGLFLLVTVAFLQVHLLRAPHGSKLSPLENGISDDEQARWKDKAGDLDKPRAVEKGKLGRKMGAFQAFPGDIEDAESGDEDMDAGEEMGDDGDDEEDDRFDVDIDDRVLEDESEDLEDMNLGVLAEMSNEDTAERILNETKPVHMVAENTVPSVVVEEAASVESKGSDEAMEKPVRKSSSIPDWVLDTQQKGAASEGDIQKNVEKSKGSFFWDHALGVRKKPLKENDSAVVESAAKVAVLQLRGFKEVVQNWKERFNSDDELLDDNVQQRLEGVREIEDALLLNGDGQSSSKKSSKKGRAATFDPMNPVNNPMLQDPDTSPGTWMTKSDKQILRAMRGGDHLSSSGQQLLRGKVPTAVTKFDRQASTVKASSEEKEDMSKILPADEKQGKKADSLRSNSSGKPLESSLQWGQYPGINSSLSFSDFITTFLGQESCTMNVFLVWTTPSWGFTARHQRVLESLFRFHRHACVVVFSETFDFDFFKSYSKEGYKVAVMRPNLAKLLADTACDVFTAVLPVWKEKPLFHLHYTELLRLAALYKFGGIYLDMDMIVLRPLDTLHNTVGSEIMASGELRLNGAILIFDKSSLFLKKCMDEFKSTYDETLVEWNGADLLTRVANSTVDDKGSTWRQFPSLLKIQGPFTFFPLDSSRISKFFDAPGDDTQKQHQAELMTRLSEEAYTVHLWSSITANKVPDITSLVGTILSRSCLRCKESLL